MSAGGRAARRQIQPLLGTTARDAAMRSFSDLVSVFHAQRILTVSVRAWRHARLRRTAGRAGHAPRIHGAVSAGRDPYGPRLLQIVETSPPAEAGEETLR